MRRRRKVRPHIRAAAQRSLLWLLFGVLIISGAAVGTHILSRGSGVIPYQAYKPSAVVR